MRHYYEEIGFELLEELKAYLLHLFAISALISYCPGRRVEGEPKWV
jgi:hypothetical protein